MNCPFCRHEVDPTDRYAYRQVVGYERKAVDSSRRGGSDITLREGTGVYAHGACIERAKLGVAPTQEAMAL